MEDGRTPGKTTSAGAGANMYAANVISRQPTLIPAEADGGVEFWSTIWREHERNCRGGGMLAGWPFSPCGGGGGGCAKTGSGQKKCNTSGQ